LTDSSSQKRHEIQRIIIFNLHGFYSFWIWFPLLFVICFWLIEKLYFLLKTKII
jgi:hypothetical protein